jgi:superfamily II DNA or RNA helicase
MSIVSPPNGERTVSETQTETCTETAALVREVFLGQYDRLRILLSPDKNNFVVQPYGRLSDGTATAPSWQAINWGGRLPEKKVITSTRWEVAATDVSVFIIAGVWSRDRLEFETPESEQLFDYLRLRLAAGEQSAIAKARFKKNGTLPPPPPGYEEHPLRPLAPYQQLALATTVGCEGAALFMEQGTGKTPIVVRRIMHEAEQLYAREKRAYRALVCAPKNVRHNWLNELKRFATSPGKAVILSGSQVGRIKQLVELVNPDNTSQWTVAITSYETVMRSWDAIKMINWDLIVADESHLIKSHHAKRTQQFMHLRDCGAQRMILTGTPMANTILDLFYQLEFLGRGMSGFTTIKAFREYYLKFGRRDPDTGKQVVLGWNNLPILHERLARIAVQFTKKEVMPYLPSKTYDQLTVEMTDEQREAYSRLASQLALEIEEILSTDRPVQMTITNVLTKLLRLSQVTSGYLVSDQEFDEEGNPLFKPGQRIHFFPKNPKIDLLVQEILESDSTTKFVVWTCWIPMIEKVQEALLAAGVKAVRYTGSTTEHDRQEAIRSFNEDPTVKVFVGNPSAGGVGVNLPGYVPDWEGTERDPGTNAWRTIYLASNWSMIQRSQSEDRNHGRGRCRVPIRVTDIVVPGTIDTEIIERLQNKKADAIRVQDLRELMSRLAILSEGDD